MKQNNELAFVYVVEINMTIDGSNETEVKIFSTYEKARAYFDECVSEEKANSHLMELDDKVVYEEENYFYVYQDGYGSENHYEIFIDERVVH